MEALVSALFYLAVIGGPAIGGAQVANEPHWSFRDGCKAEKVLVPASGGGYSYESYDHCKSLPRVYGGKEWAPSGHNTNPSV
jgi:hypothetical protein